MRRATLSLALTLLVSAPAALAADPATAPDDPYVWLEEVDYNRFDLLFDWALPIHFTEQLYVSPGVHLGWTDLEFVSTGEDDDPTTIGDESTRNAKAGDEFMIYGSVNIGADF